MTDRWVKLLSTFFYVGRSPVAPGSMASVVAVFLSIIFHQWLAGYIILFAVVTVLGFWVSGRMETITKQKDPSCVVIDEVAGMMAGLFMLPLNWPVVITAFFLFRAFDMFKLYPVNKFEEIGGSSGIMLDDLIAGIYTNLTMHIAVRWAGIV